MDFRVLIPELSDWNDGKGIDIDSWIMTVGNIKYAIGCIHLLWKDFIEYDSCIFRKDAFDVQIYRKCLAATKGDKTAVEKLMNHLHLRDLFQMPDDTDQQIIYLAGKMKELWECKLAKDFSDLPAVVELYDCEENEYMDCQITVYLKRD
jgi:hypothetical protein